MRGIQTRTEGWLPRKLRDLFILFSRALDRRTTLFIKQISPCLLYPQSAKCFPKHPHGFCAPLVRSLPVWSVLQAFQPRGKRIRAKRQLSPASHVVIARPATIPLEEKAATWSSPRWTRLSGRHAAQRRGHRSANQSRTVRLTDAVVLVVRSRNEGKPRELPLGPNSLSTGLEGLQDGPNGATT